MVNKTYDDYYYWSIQDGDYNRIIDESDIESNMILLSAKYKDRIKLIIAMIMSFLIGLSF